MYNIILLLINRNYLELNVCCLMYPPIHIFIKWDKMIAIKMEFGILTLARLELCRWVDIVHLYPILC